VDAYDYTAEFTLVGITESNFLGYTGGHVLGLAGQGTAKAVLPRSISIIVWISAPKAKRIFSP